MSKAFKARVGGVFSITGRGTVVEVELLEGVVRGGDRLRVPVVSGGTRTVTVAAVEIIDRRGEGLSSIGLVLPGFQADEVAIGAEVGPVPSRFALPVTLLVTAAAASYPWLQPSGLWTRRMGTLGELLQYGIPLGTALAVPALALYALGGVSTAGPLFDLGIRRPTGGVLGVAAAIALVAMALPAAMARGPFDTSLALPASLVVGIFCEEVVFRGYLFRQLYERLGFNCSAIVSGTMFGLWHWPFRTPVSEVVVIATAGWLFAWLFARWSCSLWPAFALHLANDWVSFGVRRGAAETALGWFGVMIIAAMYGLAVGLTLAWTKGLPRVPQQAVEPPPVT